MQNSNMSAIKKFLIASAVLMSWGPIAMAAGITSPISNATGIQNLLCNIISWFIWIVILVSVIMVVYAAFTYATAGDDTEKVATGRKTLTYAAVGIIVALVAAGFPTIVESVFPTTVNQSVACLGTY